MSIKAVRKRLMQGAKLAAPVIAAAREGDEGTPDHGFLAVIGPDSPATADLRELLGAPSGTPSGARVVVAAPRAGDIAALTPELADRRGAGRRSLTVLIGDPATRAALEAALSAGGVPVADMVHVNALDAAGRAVVENAVVRALGDDATGAARRIPALRPAVARHVVDSSARAAALMGALPLGGADLPALAYLQIRMVARLSAVHDRPLGPSRVVEAAAIVGAGFGWRTLGRAAVGLVPGVGWAAGGAVAYTGTRVTGEAALARFASGHDLVEAGPLEKVRPVFDRIVSRVGRG